MYTSRSSRSGKSSNNDMWYSISMQDIKSGETMSSMRAAHQIYIGRDSPGAFTSLKNCALMMMILHEYLRILP